MTNTTQNTINHAKDQAAAKYSCVVDMVQALNCDYDRLEELQDSLEGLTSGMDAHVHGLQDEYKELQDLIQEANGNEDQDSAREAIQEDPLSVEVRSGWGNVGSAMQAEEFCILLCTGGPAVRIRGDLDNGTPCRAWMEYQDWGTGCTQFCDASQDTLLAYCSEFYFGE